MKRFCCLLLLLWLGAASFAAGIIPVRGQVLCEGRGVEGVWVSDGDSFAQTDKKGRYRLDADGDSRFVFVCVPSGYDAPVEQGVVCYFRERPEESGVCDFTLRKRAGDDTRHGFIAVADPQIWARKEFAKLSAAADDIASTVCGYGDTPFHGLCCGDIVSHDHTLYGEYNDAMARTGIVFRNAMGNHDMTLYDRSHETSYRKFEDMYGPAWYSFDVGRIHYVVLDNNFYIGRDYFYIGYLEERQLRWLERDLSHVRRGSTVVVCMHIPSTCTEEDRKQFKYNGIAGTMTNHASLHELLRPFNAHIITGHTHTTYNQDIRPGLYEHVVPALSGAWWQGPLCTDGTPSGYGVYEVDGDQIRWHYRSTGYGADHQIALYSGAEYPEFAGYAVANVWASDPAWCVEFTVDGVVLSGERFETYDPAAKKMYSDTSGFDHKWIYPSVSDHFYRVPLPAGARRVAVTATDRFGNTSRKELTIN